jgi:DNA-directed RNA polymerase subunit beta'
MYPMKVNANVNGIELSFMKDECGSNCSIINEEQVKQKEELFVAQLNKIKEINKENGSIIVIDNIVYLAGNEQKVEISNGSTIQVKTGDIVKAGDVIGTFDPFSEPIIAEVSGYVHFEDVILGSTLEEVVDSNSGKVERYISGSRTISQLVREFTKAGLIEE